MATRKIQQSGHTYFVYLPIEWIRNNRVKEVKMTEEADQLIITPSDLTRKREYELKIHIPKYEFSLVDRIISMCYLMGYDQFCITFAEPISKKSFLEHQKNSEKMNREVSMNMVSETMLSFFNPRISASPFTVFKNMINTAMNLLRAKEQKEKELVVNFNRELWKNRGIIRRFLLFSMKDSEILREHNITLLNLWIWDNINQYLCDSLHYVAAASDIPSCELKNLKDAVEKIFSMNVKPNLDDISKLNDSILKIKDFYIRDNLKKVSRQMINWWIMVAEKP